MRRARLPAMHLRLVNGLDRSHRLLEQTRTELATRAELQSELARRLAERTTFERMILDDIDVGIVTTNRDGIVEFANRSACDLLRLAGSGCGGDVRDLLGLQSAPGDLLLSTTRRELAYPLSTRDGIELDLEVVVTRAGAENEPVGYYFLLRDVRDEKTRSAERQRFERLAAIGTMVAGFAHEVRNPVAALRSLAESLAEELADANVSLPHVGRMLQVLERIERLVRTSLQFGRPAAPCRARHRPWTLLAGAISELGPRTRELGGELRIDVGQDLPDVHVDDTQLVQVLVILINNALDSTGSPRRVLLRVERGRTLVQEGRVPDRGKDSQPPPAKPVVRFEVHDDGPGIPSELRERIFDPFFTTKPSGTGLGLSIAQQIVSDNGGELEVHSERGGPTVFAVIVPQPD